MMKDVSSYKIVVIGRCKEELKTIMQILTREGYQVYSFSSVHSAIMGEEIRKGEDLLFLFDYPIIDDYRKTWEGLTYPTIVLIPPGLQFPFPINDFQDCIVKDDSLYYLLPIRIRRFLKASMEMKRLHSLEKRFEEITTHMLDTIIIFDQHSSFLFANPPIERLTGLPPGYLVGKKIEKIDFFKEKKGKIEYLIEEIVKTGKDMIDEDEYMTHEGLKYLSLHLIPQYCSKEKRVHQIICMIKDKTGEKMARSRIHYLRFHDPLTGIYNRSFLEEEMKRLDTHRQLPLGIIIGDVNGLRMINDALGREAGDHILQEVASILKKSCRSEDIIGRWGGDEFLIFLPQIDAKGLKSICNRIKEKTYQGKKEEYLISIALGIGVKYDPPEDLNETILRAEDSMYKHKLIESRSARGTILKTLLKTLGEKSDETEEHAWRLQKMALRMGNALDLDESEMDLLSLLVSLHDIGKVVIDETILKKPAQLSQNEWDIVKTHPEVGYRICRSSSELSHIAEAILYHHERWDGSGYPNSLKGEEIPLLSRITSIIDAFDVMTNGRSYKNAMSYEEAIRELKRCAGTQFDPQLVDLFIRACNHSTS